MSNSSQPTEMNSQYALLQNIIDHVPVRIFWKDTQGRYSGANNLFLQDAQMSLSELIGKADFDMPWGQTKGQDYYYEDINIIQTGRSRLMREDTDYDQNGELKVWLTSKVVLKNPQGQIIGMLGTYEDITSRREIENQLKQQTEILHQQLYYDTLTHLPNRVLLIDRLQRAIEKGRLHKQQFALVFIDLDMFKKINDSLGHEIGDRVLREFAERLKTCVNAEDTLARLGGDEFVILYESINQVHEATELAQDLMALTEQPILIDQHVFYLSISVGLSLYPKDAHSAEDLLKCADAAMFRAKDVGRNNFQFYTDDMTQMAFEHIAMQTSLRRAVQQNEFVVVYQPQMDAYYDRIIGMEALVRWQHPELGLLSPYRFMSIAEETGIMVEIDRLVMANAMAQFVRWYDQALNPGKLSLNLTVKQLQQPDFIAWLLEKLAHTQCQPDWLEFELTESDLMTNLDQMLVKLNHLGELGIGLAIDDFGTGYSSLAYLKRLPVQKIKIDQSFIRQLPEDEEDAVITRTIIAMAEQLGLAVIAEGVETPEQRAFLLENHCHHMQGYLYSHPVDAQMMSGILARFNG